MSAHGLAARLGLLILLVALLCAGILWIDAGLEARAPSCSCAVARRDNGWCAPCKRGYVASLEIRSRILFDALDAHGHELDTNVMECANCRRLAAEGGFCEACRFGWVGGLAYMSRLTYDLAQGKTRDLDGIPCASCRALAGKVGWCTSCGGGWTGNVYFTERAAFEEAAREFARLEAAIATSARCETCSLVLLVDGRCPFCKITYAAGRPVPQ